MSPTKKLSDRERRAVILAALDPDSNITEIARHYGVSRQHVHQMALEASQEAQEALDKAQQEWWFRRAVMERIRSAPYSERRN